MHLLKPLDQHQRMSGVKVQSRRRLRTKPRTLRSGCVASWVWTGDKTAMNFKILLNLNALKSKTSTPTW